MPRAACLYIVAPFSGESVSFSEPCSLLEQQAFAFFVVYSLPELYQLKLRMPTYTQWLRLHLHDLSSWLGPVWLGVPLAGLEPLIMYGEY